MKILTTVDEVRTFSDPYRIQILQTYISFGSPATVKQVADRMKEVPANVYYHVKKMEKAGILTLDHTESINGIIAKYYEPSALKFYIGCEEHEEAAKKILLSESQRTLSKVYDGSKNIIISELKKMGTEGQAGRFFNVSMETLYLTEEQYNEACKYISELCGSNDKKVEGKNAYHFFSVFGKIE